MSRARDRRLMRDKEMVDAEFTSHPFIFVRVLGNPALPERYMVTYRLKGLMLDGKAGIEVVYAGSYFFAVSVRWLPFLVLS